MLQCFLIGGKKGGMEDRVNLPPGGNTEVECCMGDHFFHFERTSSFHLKFLGSIHVKVGGLKPDLVSYFPRGEFGGYSFFYFLLGYLVGSLGIIMSGGQVSESTFQIG